MEENVIGRPGVLNELPRLRTADAHDVFDLSDPVDQDEEDNVGTQFRQASSQRSRLTTHLGCGILMADGYSYRKDRVLKRRIGYSAYRCVERKCPARAHVKETSLKGSIVRDHEGHNPDYANYQARTALDRLEQIGRDTATETDRSAVNRQAVHEVRRNLSDEAIASTSSKEAYTRALERSRKRGREEAGDEVANVADVFGFEIPARFKIVEGLKEDNKEQFLLADIKDEDMRAVIFMSDSGRKILEKSGHIAFDGTFGIVPQHMYQLVTIHAYIEKSSVPLVYCVTNKKTKRLYKRLFEEVNAKLREAPKSCIARAIDVMRKKRVTRSKTNGSDLGAIGTG
ncbi:hypothetical protein QR680_014250 [Steinernema hermaphroditum]|uniref:FLYWCH-type domain-containing protein n=1 Tax=Steinernema hermaphroditum TaxID=289476 RepID=A0AA39I889_9BILA|nr:hypothetical protein QR680_014250 [Steinernema hermaphroditum]